MVAVGGIIALAGLGLFLVIFVDERKKRSGSEALGGWEIIGKILELVEKWTPKVYRVAVVLILIGVATMGVGVGLVAGADGDGGGTTGGTTSGPAATTTG